MTPEERNLISELFDRLATLEGAQRDAEAERAIKDGLRQAPNAAYALVQTVLVQDEALKRADGRIRELEAELGIGPEQQRQAGLDDIGRGTGGGTDTGAGRGQGLFDTAENEAGDADDAGNVDDDLGGGFDLGGGDDGP